MIETCSTRTWVSKRLQLCGGIWLGRLLLVWLLAYPVYRVLGDSGLLRSSQADRRLFAPGAENLFALLDARVMALKALSPALWLLLAIVAVLSLLGSTVVWVEVSSYSPLLARRSRAFVCEALPLFGAVTIGATALIAAGIRCWWHVSPVIGALLEPRWGERLTDLTQLVLALLGLLVVSILVLFCDVLRASVVVRRSRRVEIALLVRLCARQFHWLTAQALPRLLAACVLQLGNACVLGHCRGLGASTWGWQISVLSTELAALGSVWLRLDWIAWLTQQRWWTDSGDVTSDREQRARPPGTGTDSVDVTSDREQRARPPGTGTDSVDVTADREQRARPPGTGIDNGVAAFARNRVRPSDESLG